MNISKITDEEYRSLFGDLSDGSFSAEDIDKDEVLEVRSIDAEEIISDIRSGMALSALMEKYHLSHRGLGATVKLLLDGDRLTRGDLSRLKSLLDTVLKPEALRKFQRYYLDFDLPIVAQGSTEIVGTVKDLTERGVGTIGIPVAVDEVRTLLISHEKFVLLKPFSFQARCRWVKESQGDEKCAAGFEIISISPEDSLHLRKLLRLVTFYLLPPNNIAFEAPKEST